MILDFKKQPSERLQKSQLLRLLITDIDYFHIKWAETREEFGEAFKLVYAVTNAA